MTKNMKLTQDYIDIWKDPKGMNSKLSSNGKIFFTYVDPPKGDEESFRSKDIAVDPNNVPIYAIPQDVSEKYKGKKQVIPEAEMATYIVRYESNVEFYGCNAGECMTMPTATANKWLNSKIAISDPNNANKKILVNAMEEVV
jgi:hypothetical protein